MIPINSDIYIPKKAEKCRRKRCIFFLQISLLPLHKLSPRIATNVRNFDLNMSIAIKMVNLSVLSWFFSQTNLRFIFSIPGQSSGLLPYLTGKLDLKVSEAFWSLSKRGWSWQWFVCVFFLMSLRCTQNFSSKAKFLAMVQMWNKSNFASTYFLVTYVSRYYSGIYVILVKFKQNN